MDKAVTEAELVAASPYPRVTPAQVEAVIADKKFVYTGLHVTCILTLKNGFVVTGEAGAAVPGNYKREFGERLSYENAFNQIWPLLGYALKEKVSLVQDSSNPSHSNQRTYVGTKVIHAEPCIRSNYNILRKWELPDNENGDDEGYIVEYPDQPANTEFYQGYVSWASKDVFESTYEEMNVNGEGSVGGLDWKDRLAIEYGEVEERADKLAKYMVMLAFEALPEADKKLLKAQLSAMTDYAAILKYRLEKDKD